MVKENGMAIFLLSVLSQPNTHIMMLTQVGGGHPDSAVAHLQHFHSCGKYDCISPGDLFQAHRVHYVALNDRQLSPNDVACTNLCFSSNISLLSRLDSSVPR